MSNYAQAGLEGFSAYITREYNVELLHHCQGRLTVIEPDVNSWQDAAKIGRNYMGTEKESGRLATAFVIGSILGAGIALLLAPQSGNKTRRDIRRFGKKALNKAEALRLELGQSLDNLTNDVVERLEEEFDRGREWTEKTAQDVRNAIESGKQYIRKEIDKVKFS